MRDTGHVADLGEWVQADPQASKPLFDQLRSQIIDGIRDGRLPPGTRLPTVRELAGQLGMAVNTVARAYRELESAGVLKPVGGSALSLRAPTPPTRRWRPPRTSMRRRRRSLGIEKDEALKYVESAFD